MHRRVIVPVAILLIVCTYSVAWAQLADHSVYAPVVYKAVATATPAPTPTPDVPPSAVYRATINTGELDSWPTRDGFELTTPGTIRGEMVWTPDYMEVEVELQKLTGSDHWQAVAYHYSQRFTYQAQPGTYRWQVSIRYDYATYELRTWVP